MAKIELSWEGQHFRTDKKESAKAFVQSPNSYIPKSSTIITPEVRDALFAMLAKPPNGYSQQIQMTVNGVTITLRDRLFRL